MDIVSFLAGMGTCYIIIGTVYGILSVQKQVDPLETGYQLTAIIMFFGVLFFWLPLIINGLKSVKR